jgi:hypothetical protein
MSPDIIIKCTKKEEFGPEIFDDESNHSSYFIFCYLELMIYQLVLELLLLLKTIIFLLVRIL